MKSLTQGLIGGALGASVVLLAAALIFRSQPSEWPAWVQAVGSVGAILVAIAVDRGSARRASLQETRREAARERARLDAIQHAEVVLRRAANRAGGALDDHRGDLARAEWDRTKDEVQLALHLLTVYVDAQSDAAMTHKVLGASAQLRTVSNAISAFGSYSDAASRQTTAQGMLAVADRIAAVKEGRLALSVA